MSEPRSRAHPPSGPGPVCLIGAGSSGLAAAQVLRSRGIPFQGYEIGSDIGGIWRFRNDSGRSPAYRSLETNTSNHRTAFRTFPMPRGPARYLHNAELLAYFESFAEAFDLRDRFRFRTEVVRVTPTDTEGETGSGAGFDVTSRDLETGALRTERFGAVVVASGHHHDPNMPAFAAHFDGDVLHSREYRGPADPVDTRGRRVLVVGIGNSACDIACELAGEAAALLLSTRRGAHVLPKILFGRPIDQWVTPVTSRLPIGVQARLLDWLVRLDRGDQRRFGIDRPGRRLGQEHPTLSQDLPGHVKAGRVQMKPDVESVAGREVRFVDGSAADVDVLLCATGYHIAFPFLDPALASGLSLEGEVDPGGRVPGNRPALYHNVVPPEIPGLYVLGLIQPLGPIPPLAEAQAEWVADLLAGEAALPEPGEMRRSIAGDARRLAERFVASRRHTLEVDAFPYLRTLARERRAGRRRASYSSRAPR